MPEANSRLLLHHDLALLPQAGSLPRFTLGPSIYMVGTELMNPAAPRYSVGKTAVMLFITFLVACCYVHQQSYKSSTPVSRLDLLHSIVAHGTVRIDRYHKNTSNKSTYQGHYYSDKAPAVVVMALPAFSLAVGLLPLFGVSLNSDMGWLVSSWIACAGSLAIITAFGAVALFSWLCKWVQPRQAFVSTLALFLGAAPLMYCTLLMSHGVVVGLLAIALWAGRLGGYDGSATNRQLDWHDVLAGFCCGLALASEYSAGIVVVGILGLFIAEGRKRFVPLALGIIPPILLIPAYHWICFGTPFTIAYHHEAVFTQMHEGFFGIKFPPNPESAYSLLFSGHQGLFTCSPVLLLAFVGYHRLYSVSKVLFWVAYLVPLFQVVAISGYFLPEGGIMFGPRFLAPLLAIMALPTALGIARFPRLGVFLAALSILSTVVVTVVDIVPVPSENPLFDFYVPALIQGRLSPNLGTVLGLKGCASLIPLLLGLGIGICLIWRNLGPCKCIERSKV